MPVSSRFSNSCSLSPSPPNSQGQADHSRAGNYRDGYNTTAPLPSSGEAGIGMTAPKKNAKRARAPQASSHDSSPASSATNGSNHRVGSSQGDVVGPVGELKREFLSSSFYKSFNTQRWPPPPSSAYCSSLTSPYRILRSHARSRGLRQTVPVLRSPGLVGARSRRRAPSPMPEGLGYLLWS